MKHNRLLLVLTATHLCISCFADLVSPTTIVATGLPMTFPDHQSRRQIKYRMSNGETKTEWLTAEEENQLRIDIQRHEKDKAQKEKEDAERRKRQKEKKLEKRVRKLNRLEKQKIKIGGKRIHYTKEMLRKKK